MANERLISYFKGKKADIEGVLDVAPECSDQLLKVRQDMHTVIWNIQKKLEIPFGERKWEKQKQT